MLLRILIIYRAPPSQENNPKKKPIFLPELSNLLEYLAPLSGKLVFLGDFNIHWDKTDISERKELADLLSTFDLDQSVNGPIHKAGHTLDLVITRCKDKLVKSCKVTDFFLIVKL